MARKRNVTQFPDQVLPVELSPQDRARLNDLKRAYGLKTDSGTLRRLLRDYAEREGIRPKKKR